MQNKFLIYKSQVQCEFLCVWFYYHKQLVATLCISDHLNLNALKCFGRKEIWNFWNSKGKLASRSDYSQRVVNLTTTTEVDGLILGPLSPSLALVWLVY